MSRDKITPSLTLGAICLAVAALLAVINIFTAPVIERNKNAAANAALTEVLPDGTDFKELELNDSYPSVITAAYSADGGFVFRAEVTGKSSGLIIMCGIDTEGRIVGTKVVSNGETPAYAEKVFPLVEGTDGEYRDMTLSDFEAHIVAGATLTSRAYGEAVKAALQAFTIANGGEVDLRTPEEILRDELRAALGKPEAEFDRWFATVETGAEAIYTERGGDGAVAVIDGVKIGIVNGASVTEGVTEDAKAKAAEAVLAMKAAEAAGLTEVALPEGTPAAIANNVTKIYKTADGSYLFELKAAGYGILGGNKWHPASGEYIIIKLAISAEGRIISTLTVSEGETDGLGDACATPDYYEKYNGKDEEGLADVPPISGATITSDGYKNAVKSAFAVLALLNAQEEVTD